MSFDCVRYKVRTHFLFALHSKKLLLKINSTNTSIDGLYCTVLYWIGLDWTIIHVFELHVT